MIGEYQNTRNNKCVRYLPCPRYVGHGIAVGLAVQLDHRVLFGVDVTSRCHGLDSRRDCNRNAGRVSFENGSWFHSTILLRHCRDVHLRTTEMCHTNVKVFIRRCRLIPQTVLLWTYYYTVDIGFIVMLKLRLSKRRSVRHENIIMKGTRPF